MPTLQHTAPPRLESTPSRSVDRLLGGIAVAVPVILFWIIWSYYAVNVPKWDDHALRGFLYDLDEETTFFGKIYQFFRQHNEHRIVVDRLVAFIDYNVTGKLNFRHLMAVGNLSLIGIVLLLMDLFRREGRSAWYVVPVPFLLLNLANWENMYWGMAALQNFWIVFWSMLTCYLLAYTQHWRWAVAVATLATLTSGNGLLIWPIGIILLALRSVDSQIGGKHRFLPLVAWIVSAGIVIGLYFAGYKKPAGNPPDKSSVFEVVKGGVAFLGASVEALPVRSALQSSVLFGGALVLVAILLIGFGLLRYGQVIGHTILQFTKSSASGKSKAIPPIALFFWGVMAFIFGTTAVVAWGRTGFGLDLIITSRYKIYSLLLLVMLYVYVVLIAGRTLGKWIMVGGIAGSVLFYWSSYFSFLDEAIWFRHWQLTNQFNWTYTMSKPISTLKPEAYTEPAPAFYDVALPVIYGPAEQNTIPLTVIKQPTGYLIETHKSTPADLLKPQTVEQDAGSYLLARSAKRSYLFPVRPNKRSLIQARLWPFNQFTDGFKTEIMPGTLEPGTYQLFVLRVTSQNQCKIYPTNQLVTSSELPKDVEKNW